MVTQISIYRLCMRTRGQMLPTGLPIIIQTHAADLILLVLCVCSFVHMGGCMWRGGGGSGCVGSWR